MERYNTYNLKSFEMTGKKPEELFLDQSGDRIWMIDTKLLLIYANQTYLNLISLVKSKKTKQSDTLVAVWGEGSIDKWTSYYKKALAGDCFELEEQFIYPGNNKLKLGQITFTPVRTEKQEVIAVACQSGDILEPEMLLQQSEQRFKDLVQEGSDLIGILSSDGIYSYVSPTSFAILGMQPEGFIGKSPLEFIHSEDLERTMASLQKISEQKKVQVEPFRFKNKRQEWRWIETVLTNMVDSPTVKGIVANSRDITENVNIFRDIEANEQFSRCNIKN